MSTLENHRAEVLPRTKHKTAPRPGLNVRTHVHLSPVTHNMVRELAFVLNTSFAGALEMLVLEALEKRGEQPKRDILFVTSHRQAPQKRKGYKQKEKP